MSLSRRRYDSYDAYLAHQAAKLPQLMGSEWATGFAIRRQGFVRRLSEILPFINRWGSVICLGARTGEEVAAFVELGLDAIGVDLNPGAGNEFVVRADFHRLPFGDQEFDLVYTNSLDHAWDLGGVARECARVLRPGSSMVVELGTAFDSLNRRQHLRRPNSYEAVLWDDDDELLSELRGFEPMVRFKNPAADYRTIVMRHMV